MSTLGKRLWNKRHRDWEAFDKIELEIVERWKESHLSGSEWRFSVLVRFFFKGEHITCHTFGDMRSAIMCLGQTWLESQSPISDRIIELEKDKCDQPGCKLIAENFFVLKKEYSREGFERQVQFSDYFRKFCRKHSTRGDCSLEDSDSNYVKVEKEQLK